MIGERASVTLRGAGVDIPVPCRGSVERVAQMIPASDNLPAVVKPVRTGAVPPRAIAPEHVRIVVVKKVVLGTRINRGARGTVSSVCGHCANRLVPPNTILWVQNPALSLVVNEGHVLAVELIRLLVCRRPLGRSTEMGARGGRRDVYHRHGYLLELLVAPGV